MCYPMCLQGTFQAVLATNGQASFAVFSYSDINRIRDITEEGVGIIGFDAGSGRGTTMAFSTFPVKNPHIFRIDGKNDK